MGRPDGGGGGSADGVVKMSDEAVRTVKKRFRTTALEAYGASEDLPDALEQLGSAAGPFYAELAGGATPFTASWQATLEVIRTEAQLIAGNVNNLSIDLDRLDDGSS